MVTSATATVARVVAMSYSFGPALTTRFGVVGLRAEIKTLVRLSVQQVPIRRNTHIKCGAIMQCLMNITIRKE